MKKFVFGICVLGAVQLQAQTLFTYGKKSVTKQSFLTAFNKNPSANTNKKEALNEYKELYVNFKLKVQSAIDTKLDEQKGFVQESNNFKRQIADNVINEEANAKLLLEEAFKRSQKDIEVAQIFIASNNDSLQARIEANNAYRDLKAGKSFEETLMKYSNDEAVKKAKGNIGFVTVFTLPYEIENAVFTLPKGGFSAPYKSAYGFHIFKNVNERFAAGKRRVAQILLAYPPNATADEKAKVNAKADEVYAKVKRGENFGMLAADYSNDYATANNKGDMGEIGLGKYNKDFEEKIFGLKNVGDISEKFTTAYGIHILKLLELIPVAKNLDDANYSNILKNKLDNSDRLAIAKKNLIEKWRVSTGFRKAFYNANAVFGFIDSVLMDKPTDIYIGTAGDSTLLFSFHKQRIKVADFIEYVKSIRFNGSEESVKPYEDLIISFENQSISDYYKNHIEDFCKSCIGQLQEFDEANLLFSAMDKNVWSKASEDSVGLKNYFTTNASKYNWQAGVSAITVSANSLTLATELHDKIVANPSNWRMIVSEEGSKATSDSGRYEFEQMPVKAKIEKREGFATNPEKMGSDETFSFIVITKVYETVTQRSFEESRGLVINDYQQQLEKEWLLSLKKQYPVVFKDAVWQSVLGGK